MKGVIKLITFGAFFLTACSKQPNPQISEAEKRIAQLEAQLADSKLAEANKKTAELENQLQFKKDLGNIHHQCEAVLHKYESTSTVTFSELPYSGPFRHTWNSKLKSELTPKGYFHFDSSLTCLAKAFEAQGDNPTIHSNMHQFVREYNLCSSEIDDLLMGVKHSNEKTDTISIQPNGELTRDLAAKLIDAYPASVPSFAFKKDGIKAAIKDGLMQEKGGFGSIQDYFFTQRGLAIMGAFIKENVIYPHAAGSNPEVLLKTPIAVKVTEVTGIALGGDPNVRKADYVATYLWPEQMSAIVTYGFGRENASATFRRYDDGWRITELEHP